MREPDWESMDEQAFEELLESSVTQPPPEQVVAEVTPWRLATKRILTGIALTSITLNFFWLNYLLPAIGIALMLLGFRALRRENRCLSLCFGLAVLRAVHLYATLILNSTIWFSAITSSPLLYGLTVLNLALTYTQLLCLWGGFRAVQQKAGLPPHAGSAVALLIWYGITGLLGALGYSGLILPLVMLVCYILILRSLWKLSRELDQAGYAIRPAPVRVTDTVLAIAIAAVVVIGCLCGLLLGCKYPMDWQAADPAEHSGVEKIEAQLLDLGFPDYVLQDLTAEDIAACEGALRVVWDVDDRPLNNGRIAATVVQTEDGQSVTRKRVYDVEELRITGVAVELPGNQGRWMIFHHFLWTVDPGFYGTESIQLWPASRTTLGTWHSTGAVTGRVLYERDGTTYTAPYYYLGEQTFTSSSIFWGEETSSDVFAAFSMPGTGENHRGYLAYPMEAVEESRLIDSWFNYTHQRTALQYPAMTAMDFRMSGAWDGNSPFRTIQDALQFRPSEVD